MIQIQESKQENITADQAFFIAEGTVTQKEVEKQKRILFLIHQHNARKSGKMQQSDFTRGAIGSDAKGEHFSVVSRARLSDSSSKVRTRNSTTEK